VVVLVACETLVLVLLVVLVVGLLRSHAEILRRLGPPREEGEAQWQHDPSLPEPGQRAGVREGHDIVGTTLVGDAVQIGLGAEAPPTLLAFLSSGCSVCSRFWDDLRSRRKPSELPAGIRLLTITKDVSEESPSRLRELAGEVPVVMSSAAWADYGAPAAPYFVYVRGGDVHGEGSASNWRQIASLLRDAVADGSYERNGERRTGDVDRILASAGIGPGHPSLYPGKNSTQTPAAHPGQESP
jgi:hypothetical protein